MEDSAGRDHRLAEEWGDSLGADALDEGLDICRAGILFVADEVVAGFGQVGTWFASDRFDLRPDMTISSKGHRPCYLPLGSLTVSLGDR